MGVSTIDPRQPLTAALRTQLADVRERARARARSAAATAKTDAAMPGAAAAMAQRIAAIGRADPDRRRKAVRIFLETELAREFGAGLLNDPVFPEMLDAVQQQMQDDGQAAAAVHALGELLLGGPA